jgi:hypothetical protein
MVHNGPGIVPDSAAVRHSGHKTRNMGILPMANRFE